MPIHRHEPTPARTRSLAGHIPDFSDIDAYPMLSECQHCGRFIRADVLNGSWRTTEEREGLQDWPLFISSKDTQA